MATAIYARISEDRTGAGLGVDRQEADCRKLAQSKGWNVGPVFVDNDVTAFKRRTRKGYQALLEGIRVGDVDRVVAWHSDRLLRRPRELEDLIDLCDDKGKGVPIEFVIAGPYDLTTANGRMIARISAAVDSHESEHKSERIRRKHVELAENGKVPGGGRRPFGYNKDRKTIRRKEADLIRDAAARVLAGESVRSIAVDWQRRGIKSVTGAQWSPTTLKRLLMSGRISGQRDHLGVMYPAEWPAIIDPDTTARLRAVLSDPSRAKAPWSNAREYLLSGFVVCGNPDCKAKMTARPVMRKGHRYRRYHCLTDRGGCNKVGIGAQPLEDLVSEMLLYRLERTPKLAKEMKRRRAAGTTKTKASMESLASLEQRLAELPEMYAAGEITRAQWVTAQASIEKKLTDARGTLAEGVRDDNAAAVLGDPEAIRREWDDPDTSLDRRRAILGVVLDRVVIAPTSKQNNRFDPSRVEPIWRV